MYLNSLQKKKVSDMLMNVSQALFISALIGPAITSAIGILQVVQATCLGLLFFYVSLKLIEDE